jgi:SAM-dependent methyltransferase
MAGRHRALNAWLSAPLGRALVAAESELLTEALDDVFGWELLQVGRWGAARELLAGSRTRRQTIIAPPARENGADVVARPPQLPVPNASIDAVLLPHTLELEPDPYAVIREVDRVLVGEGQLLVLGFRPWSLWGLRSAAARRGFPPGLKRLIPERRLRDWLVLLGYEVLVSRRYLYCVPWGTPDPPNGGASHMLRRGLLNPAPAGAYLLKARKRIYALTPLRARMRERPSVLGGLVEPTTRSPGRISTHTRRS